MMKRIALLMCLVMCLSLLLCACRIQDGGGGADTTTQSVTDAPSTEPSATDPTVTVPPTTEPPTTEPVTTEPSDPNALPEYVPGSIKLQEQNSYEYPFERKYRLIYYTYDYFVFRALTPEQQADWEAYMDENFDSIFDYAELEEMLLVTMIKRYNMPREEFDRAVAKYKVASESAVCEELWEIPNGDIIYTFDNEIINYYYRYA